MSNEETIWYEIEMLRFCYRSLTQRKLRPLCDAYAYLECFLLHYRNLIAFFSGNHSRGTGPNGYFDIHLRNLSQWASGQSPTEAEVKPLVDAALKLDGEHYDDLSKYLAHVTTRRLDAKTWNEESMYKEIDPIIEGYAKLLPQQRCFCSEEIVAVVAPESASTATWKRSG